MAERVAIISDSAPPYGGGGIASAHYALFKGLRQRGIEAALFTYFDRVFPDQPEEHIHRFGPPPRLTKNLLRLNRMLFALIQPGRKAWYAIDSLASGLGVRRMAWALAAYRPDVVIFPDQGSPALLLPKPAGATWGLIAHHNPLRFQHSPLAGEFSALDARLAIAFEQRALRKIDRATCPSRHMREWFGRAFRFDGPVAVIPNVPDVESAARAAPHDLRPALGLAPDAPLLAIPSGEVRLKGTEFIFPILGRLAAGYLQPFGVFIAGELEAGLAAQLPGLPPHVRLHLPGRLAHGDYLARLKACSFGLFPSLIDNYSMALVEASLAGVPMLAFDAGGNADILADGENGRLLPAYDWEALASAALNLLNAPPELATLRERTAAYRPRTFDPQAVVEEYVRFFIQKN
ncbi:MAG: glycosyltransferase family 4 protein [Chloroflexi bacterium]|nr:glycosyltransferase family 4 protein [Chloroflexota bacterium]